MVSLMMTTGVLVAPLIPFITDLHMEEILERAAEAGAADPQSRGVVLGGSGNGEQIAANKVDGIRAALAWTPELAGLAREHNNAQVVSIGGRFTETEVAKAIVDVFLSTEFVGGTRHQRRLDMVTAYEQDGTLPPLP